MSLTYAIADLHGRSDLLKGAFVAISGHAPVGRHTIVTLGDYIDRGPDSRGVIETLMKGAPTPNFDLVCLKGNHEDMMLQVLGAKGLISWWLENGGNRTLISYGNKIGEKANVDVLPPDQVAWLASLPTYRQDAHRLFVHAGATSGVPLHLQDNETLLWMLYLDGAEDGYRPTADAPEKHVVHGHHQFAHGPLTFRGRTDLDTFAWATGRLVIGIFDDDKAGGPIDFIEVQGPTVDEIRKIEGAGT